MGGLQCCINCPSPCSAAAVASELHRSSSTSSTSNAGGLVPRAPTGSDWTRSNNKGDRSSVGLTEFLKDLDRQAGYVFFVVVVVACAVVMCFLLVVVSTVIGVG